MKITAPTVETKMFKIVVPISNDVNALPYCLFSFRTFLAKTFPSTAIFFILILLKLEIAVSHDEKKDKSQIKKNTTSHLAKLKTIYFNKNSTPKYYTNYKDAPKF